MNESVFDQPTPEQLQGFVEGDPVAIDGVVRLILPQLYRWAVRRSSGLPEADVCSVVNQVLAEICIHHDRYDPNKASITTYAIKLIRLRQNNLYATEKGIANNERSDTDLHERHLTPAYNQTDATDDDTRIAREDFFHAVEAQLDGVERDFLRLIRDGEKSQAAFADVLARYGDVPDPARDVKNSRERLMRKLRAISQDRGYSLADLL